MSQCRRLLTNVCLLFAFFTGYPSLRSLQLSQKFKRRFPAATMDDDVKDDSFVTLSTDLSSNGSISDPVLSDSEGRPKVVGFAPMDAVEGGGSSPVPKGAHSSLGRVTSFKETESDGLR